MTVMTSERRTIQNCQVRINEIDRKIKKRETLKQPTDDLQEERSQILNRIASLQESEQEGLDRAMKIAKQAPILKQIADM